MATSRVIGDFSTDFFSAPWLYGLIHCASLYLRRRFFSGISAWLIAVNLKDVFNVPFGSAAALSVLCALEPLQLLSERYILTDTTALFLFAVLVTLTLTFCRRRTVGGLILVLLTGAVLIGVRISYLPVVLLNSLVLPPLWLRSRLTGWISRPRACTAFCSLFL